MTWNALSSSVTSARFSKYALFDNAGSSLFAYESALYPALLGLLNSLVVVQLIKAISPTLNYQPGDIAKLPAYLSFDGIILVSSNTSGLAHIARRDWDAYERSWEFQ